MSIPSAQGTAAGKFSFWFDHDKALVIAKKNEL
jgi:hypothetical protein